MPRKRPMTDAPEASVAKKPKLEVKKPKRKADLTSRLSVPTLESALTALLKDADKHEKNRAKRAATTGKTVDEIMPGEVMVYLTVTLKQPPLKTKLRPYCIPLKHGLYTPGEDEICFFVKDPQRQMKDHLAEHGNGGVTRIMGVEKLRKRYKTHESRRELVRHFDMFLVDHRIAPMMPALLGNAFLKAKKMPLPVDVRKDVVKGIEKAISCTSFSLRQGTCFTVMVGKAEWEVEQLRDNFVVAMDGVVSKIEGGWLDIQTVSVKTNRSPALPVFVALPTSMEMLEAEGVEVKNGNGVTSKKRGKKAPVSENPAVEKLNNMEDDEASKVDTIEGARKKGKHSAKKNNRAARKGKKVVAEPVVEDKLEIADREKDGSMEKVEGKNSGKKGKKSIAKGEKIIESPSMDDLVNETGANGESAVKDKVQGKKSARKGKKKIETPLMTEKPGEEPQNAGVAIGKSMEENKVQGNNSVKKGKKSIPTDKRAILTPLKGKARARNELENAKGANGQMNKEDKVQGNQSAKKGNKSIVKGNKVTGTSSNEKAGDRLENGQSTDGDKVEGNKSEKKGKKANATPLKEIAGDELESVEVANGQSTEGNNVHENKSTKKVNKTPKGQKVIGTPSKNKAGDELKNAKGPNGRMVEENEVQGKKSAKKGNKSTPKGKKVTGTPTLMEKSQDKLEEEKAANAESTEEDEVGFTRSAEKDKISATKDKKMTQASLLNEKAGGKLENTGAVNVNSSDKVEVEKSGKKGKRSGKKNKKVVGKRAVEERPGEEVEGVEAGYANVTENEVGEGAVKGKSGGKNDGESKGTAERKVKMSRKRKKTSPAEDGKGSDYGKDGVEWGEIANGKMMDINNKENDDAGGDKKGKDKSNGKDVGKEKDEHAANGGGVTLRSARKRKVSSRFGM